MIFDLVVFIGFVSQQLFWNGLSNVAVSYATCVGCATATMLTYISDRVVDSKVDVQTEVHKRVLHNWRPRVLVILCFYVASAMLNFRLLALTMACIPLYLTYSIGVFGFTVKDLQVPAVKNMFVAFVWTVWFLGVPGTLPPSDSLDLAVCWTYFRFVFQMVVIQDFKDTESDRRKNVLTLPVVYGERNTVRILLANAWLTFAESCIVFHSVPLGVSSLALVAILHTVDLSNATRATQTCLFLQIFPGLVQGLLHA
jgi:4-hydroxybenzoate polyprenyltransferase